jgi:hypothetical protein
VGIGLNFTATFLNAGKMPILQSALDMAKITDNAQLYLSYFGATNQLTITNPYVMGLCKILGVPLGITGLPISAGDIIIAISMFFVIQKMMVVPQSRKATPQERFAYTNQLKYTSEYSLDEIAKAAKEESDDLISPTAANIKASKNLGNTSAASVKTAKKTFDESFLLADDFSNKKKDNVELALDSEFESGSEDLQDDDEFDSFLQKLDNINKQEDKKEEDDFEKDPYEKNVVDNIGKSQYLKTETAEKQPKNIELDPEEENENIAKFIDDLEQDGGRPTAKKASEIVSNEDIQNIVSELNERDDTYAEEEEYIDEELEEQKSENADQMLNYMLSIFEKQKRAQRQAAQKEEEENAIYANAQRKDDYGPYTSKPKISLFDDIKNEYKNQQNDYYYDNANTTNPFVIENGRIIENPNYKFRKTADTDYRKKESEPKDEEVIAFDSSQNLEFIRKEIFAELKKQEEEANNNAFYNPQTKSNINKTQTVTDFNQSNNREQTYGSDISSKNSGAKEEYERVEFEIDGKTMYVWIKK